jgi:hypothetical protein
MVDAADLKSAGSFAVPVQVRRRADFLTVPHRRGERGLRMATKKMYYVIGGIFKTTDFLELEPGGGEIQGPFPTEAVAEKIRDASTRKNLDICCHKVFVTSVDVPV